MARVAQPAAAGPLGEGHVGDHDGPHPTRCPAHLSAAADRGRLVDGQPSEHGAQTGSFLASDPRATLLANRSEPPLVDPEQETAELAGKASFRAGANPGHEFLAGPDLDLAPRWTALARRIGAVDPV